MWYQKYDFVYSFIFIEVSKTLNLFAVPKHTPHTHWARHNEKIKLKQRKSEIKTNDQILKARLLAEKKKQRQKKGKSKNKGRQNRK